MSFSHASRTRLTDRDLGRFPNNTLFHRLARAVCGAGCLPRRELYEAWEMARRIRRRFRGGRIVDLAAGHGLLAQALLLLDAASPGAIAVDPALPPSSAALHRALVAAWPRLDGRIAFLRSAIDDVEIGRNDIVVASHACGALTDRVLARAVSAQARVAVLPCCHDLDEPDADSFAGWMDGALAIDAMRVVRLRTAGYRVSTHALPADITAKNRLILAEPGSLG
jgi:hypothetical protein